MGWPWDDEETAPADPRTQPRFNPDALSPAAKRQLVRPHLPSPDELTEERERQTKEEQGGLLSTILGLPEKVFFGQAIKGAVKGAAEGGLEGGVEGFLRGTPFAFLWDTVNDLWGGEDVARTTNFAEIRKAFGATDVDEGAGNFFINLLGEIALSPIELFAAPFALTKAGIAAKATMQSTETLAQALQLGNRAALVLKVPGFHMATNLGFKSGFVLPAAMLDSLGNLARTNKVANAIAKTFEMAYNLPTLDGAKRAKQALDISSSVKRSMLAMTEVQYRQLSPEARQIAADKGLGDIITVAGEVGIDKIDFDGSLDGVIEALKNPDVAKRLGRRQSLLDNNPTFKGLWDAATVQYGAAGYGKRESAIRAIIKEFPDIPLTDEMLATVGMERRLNVETTWIGDGTPPVGDPASTMVNPRAATAEALARSPENVIEGDAFTTPLEATPRALVGEATAGQAARADTATEVQERLAGAIRGGREKVVKDLLTLQEHVKAGKVSGDAFNEFLGFQKRIFSSIGAAEITHGLMNQALEPFLGMYAPHILNENVMNLANERFLSVLKKYNYTSPRALKDMTALEANIIAEDFGNKALGFFPLKDLKPKNGLAVWQKIFDHDFIKQLHKVDPEGASVFRAMHDEDSFFRIDPLKNLRDRVGQSAERFANRAMQKHFYGAMAVEELTPQEFALRKSENYFGEGSEYVAVLETTGGFDPLTRGRAIEEYALAPELETEFLIAKTQAEDNFHQQIQANGINAENALADLQSSRLLHENSIADDLAVKQGELLATANVKRSILAVKEAKDRYRGIESAWRSSVGVRAKRGLPKGVVATESRAAYAREWEAFQALGGTSKEKFHKELFERVKEAREEVASATASLKSNQAAVESVLDSQLDAAYSVTEGFKAQRRLVRGQAADTAANIGATRRQSIDVASEMRRLGLNAKRVAEESAIQRQIAQDGGLALDEAAQRVVGTGKDGKEITLFDRVFSRLDPSTKIKVLRREDFAGFRALQADLHRPDPFRNNSFVRMIDNFKAGWAAHTINNPLFVQTRVRNAVQAMGSSLSAGLFSISGQTESFKISQAISRMSMGDKSAMEALKAIPVSGTKVSLYDAFNLALENGAVNFSSAYADGVSDAANKAASLTTVGEAAGNAVKYFKSNPFSATKDLVMPRFMSKSDSPINQLGSTMEGAADQWQRMASFLGGLKKGMAPAEAGQAVRKWLYDSSLPLTWTERTLFRRVMPFYSFQKYALRTFSEMYLTRPATLTWFDKYQKESKRRTGVENIDTVLPPFVTESFGIVTKNDATGAKVRLFGGWFNIGEAAAVADAFDREQQAGDGTGSPFIRYAMNKMHPALRTIAEQISNKDFFSDRDLEAYPGEAGEFMGMVMPKRIIRIMGQMRFLNELNKLNVFNASEFRVMSNAVSRSAIGKSPEMSLLSKLINSPFSPLPVPGERDINVQQEASYRQSKDEAVLRDLKGKIIRRIAAPDAMPTKQKDLAALRDLYKETGARILRRGEAAASYGGPETKADVRRLRRLQVNRIAGTGTAPQGE